MTGASDPAAATTAALATAALATHGGGCHCGAIRVTLAFSKPAAELQARACQCGFCMRHGARTVSDPTGRVILELDQTRTGFYQFATRSARALVCQNCGVYAGVLLEVDGQAWSTINVRGMAIAAFAGHAAEPVVYDGETAAERTARRRRNWTPTEVRVRHYY